MLSELYFKAKHFFKKKGGQLTSSTFNILSESFFQKTIRIKL